MFLVGLSSHVFEHQNWFSNRLRWKLWWDLDKSIRLNASPSEPLLLCRRLPLSKRFSFTSRRLASPSSFSMHWPVIKEGMLFCSLNASYLSDEKTLLCDKIYWKFCTFLINCIYSSCSSVQGQDHLCSYAACKRSAKRNSNYIILHTKPPVARPVKTVNQQSNEYIKTRKTSASATMRGLHNIDILMSHENSSNRRKFHFIVGMSNVFQPVLASLA